jgi:hypothetical protein
MTVYVGVRMRDWWGWGWISVGWTAPSQNEDWTPTLEGESVYWET